MTIERTFSIIKPDAVARNLIGEIYRRFERAGLRIIAAKMLHLTRRQAEGFYAIHRGKPFFEPLVASMTAGPIMIQVLEGEDAIKLNRELMGMTNPADAAFGTIRADFASNTVQNAVHGSDSPETAKEEITYFFSEHEITSRDC